MKENNEFYKEVGRKIRYFREKENMTQEELGSKLGVTKNAVYSWETGRCTLHLQTAKQICKELDITLSQLIDN